jgi:hypothetical protein
MSYNNEAESMIKKLTIEKAKQFRLQNYAYVQDLEEQIRKIKDEELNKTKFIQK